MKKDSRTREELLREVEALRARAEESEDVLRAIRNGEVDAVVVSTPQGERVYTLKGADHTYRMLVEQMPDAALTLTLEGDILYCNHAFAKMVKMPLEKVIGGPIRRFLAPPDEQIYSTLLHGEKTLNGGSRDEIHLKAADGALVPAYLSMRVVDMDGTQAFCLVVTDLSEQKRNEEIVASERLARLILDQAAEAIVVCDEQGRIIRASQEAHLLCGGNPVLQPFDGAFRLQLSTGPGGGAKGKKAGLFSIATALRGEVIRGLDAVLDRPDGQALNLLLSAGPLRGENKKIIGCVITLTNTTERKRAAEALQASEERYRGIFAGIPDGIVVHDADGLILDANEAMARRLEIPREALPGRKLVEFVTPDNAPTIIEHAANTLRGLSQVFETTYVSVSGKTIPAEVHEHRIPWKNGQAVLSISRDITERKRAEATLFETNQRLQALMKALPVGVSFSDDATCQRITGNPAVLAQFEVRPEDNLSASAPDGSAPGRQVRFFKEGRQISAAELPLQRAVAENQTIPPMELEVVLPSGRRWHTAASGAPIRDAQGNVVGGVAVTVDITERKQAEEDLRKALADLIRSNKELEQFAYVASHDLQEPLRMVSSYVDLLARRYQGKLDADADEFIAYAVDGSRRMQRMIEDLLAFSRVGTRGKPLQSTDANTALDHALSNLQVAIEEAGAVVARDPLPTVMADETQLVQLFQNLIDNAVKFRGKDPPRAHVSAKDAGKAWVFSVRDNGIGIDPQYFDRIFVIFQHLHPARRYGGTGIGLSICKKIVERHGGRIWIESQKGKGSTFFFSIPKRGEEAGRVNGE